MNVTIMTDPFVYSAAEKGILPLAGIVLTPAMSTAMYMWSRRRLRGDEQQEQRAYIFYRALSGTLLGLFLCHIFFKSTTYSSLGPSVMAVLVILGVCLIDIYDNWTRVWNDNKYWVSSNQALVDTEMTLDRTTMEEQDYIKVSGEDMTSPVLGQIMFGGQDERKDNKRRWHIFICLFACMTFVVILQGLFLIYNDKTNKLLLICAYFITQGLQNVVIFGGMVHAKIHTQTKPSRYRWWWSLTFIWTVIVTCAVIPVLVDADYDKVANAVTNNWLCTFYSIVAGMILGISFHFRGMKLKKTNKKNTAIAICVYIIFAFISWATGLYV